MIISIVTACRNAEKTIIDCLESIRCQQLPEGQSVEHILCEGASTDRTAHLIQDYVADHTGGDESAIQYRVLTEPDGGLYEALNKGSSLASGDVVGFLHGDDFYADDRVLARVSQTLRERKTDGCYGDLVYVDDHSDRLRVTRFWRAGVYKLADLFLGWMPPHPTLFLWRRCYEVLGGFRTDLGSAADYEFILRSLVTGRLDVAYIPEVLVCMRTGGMSNATWSGRVAAHLSDRRAWRMNGLTPRPWTLLCKPLRKLGQWLKPTAFRPERWWRPASARPHAALGVILAGLFLGTSSVHAQNAVFRYSSAGPWAYSEAKAANQAPREGIKVGNIFFQTSGRLSTVYNSNTTLSEKDPVADIYVIPRLGVRVMLPLSDINSLDLSLDFGYQAGFNSKDPNRNQFQIGTNSSGLDLKVFAGDFLLRLYDAPSLSSTPNNDPTLTNVGEYSIFSNTLGTSLTLDLYQFVATLGCEWRAQTSLGSDYAYLNNSQYIGYFTAFVPVSSSFAAGGFLSADYTSYPSSYLANSLSFTGGAALEGQLSRYTSVFVRLGAQYILFNGGDSQLDGRPLDGVPATTLGGNSYFGPYAEIKISNQISRYIFQRLSLSNEAMPSINANFTYYVGAEYSVSWQVLEPLVWSASAQFGYGNNSGLYDDLFTYFSGSTRLSYQINRGTTAFIGGGFYDRSSSASGLSYEQFMGGAGLEVNF